MNFKILLLTSALMGAFTLATAAEATTDTTTSTKTVSKVSVDAQIEKIKNAKASERVALMNEFKKQVMTMNAEERQAAISEMQTKMKAQSDTIVADANQNAQNTQAQAKGMQEQTQNMQAKQAEDMAQLQNMAQQQAASQAGRMMNNVNNVKQTLGH